MTWSDSESLNCLGSAHAPGLRNNFLDLAQEEVTRWLVSRTGSILNNFFKKRCYPLCFPVWEIACPVKSISRDYLHASSEMV